MQVLYNYALNINSRVNMEEHNGFLTSEYGTLFCSFTSRTAYQTQACCLCVTCTLLFL